MCICDCARTGSSLEVCFRARWRLSTGSELCLSTPDRFRFWLTDKTISQQQQYWYVWELVLCIPSHTSLCVNLDVNGCVKPQVFLSRLTLVLWLFSVLAECDFETKIPPAPFCKRELLSFLYTSTTSTKVCFVYTHKWIFLIKTLTEHTAHMMVQCLMSTLPQISYLLVNVRTHRNSLFLWPSVSGKRWMTVFMSVHVSVHMLIMMYWVRGNENVCSS